jgi:hypothetical protein
VWSLSGRKSNVHFSISAHDTILLSISVAAHIVFVIKVFSGEIVCHYCLITCWSIQSYCLECNYYFTLNIGLFSLGKVAQPTANHLPWWTLSNENYISTSKMRHSLILERLMEGSIDLVAIERFVQSKYKNLIPKRVVNLNSIRYRCMVQPHIWKVWNPMAANFLLFLQLSRHSTKQPFVNINLVYVRPFRTNILNIYVRPSCLFIYSRRYNLHGNRYEAISINNLFPRTNWPCLCGLIIIIEKSYRYIFTWDQWD